MVLVFDLDEESCDSDIANGDLIGSKQQQPILGGVTINSWTRRSVLENKKGKQQRRLQNVGSFSAALACYPVISQIARDLDLNTLDNLARTCHLFQALLNPHTKSLIPLSLRCSNDKRIKPRHQRGGDANAKISDKVNGNSKRSPCATDLVGECRRCSILVCRNCTAKTLPPAKVIRRHRRLCNVCVKAPISDLIAPYMDFKNSSFTFSAFVKAPCECPLFFWLCQPCGQYLPQNDNDYHRIWNWRIRYSTYLGGLGTGIGEGYEGVKCGRGEECLASRKIEVEEDCTAEPTLATPRDGSSRPTSQHSMVETPDYDPEKAGYFRQEVEGIGGLMRGKIKKMVVVGQTVQEHEDERENGDYLSREAKGLSRSWCSWCERVILSSKDRKKITEA